MTGRRPRKRIIILGALAFVVLAAVVLVGLMQKGRHMGIEVPEGKVEYIARLGSSGTMEPLPTRANERLELTNHGSVLREDGSWVARLWIDKTVYPEGTNRFDWGTTVEPVAGESDDHFVEVSVGDQFEYEGYIFRLTTVDVRSDRETHAGFIIENLPEDVTVFPSGDPSVW